MPKLPIRHPPDYVFGTALNVQVYWYVACPKASLSRPFGQIKQARGFRQFLLRGIEKVRAEWALVCTAHNLLKLARWRSLSAALPSAAAAG
jgi:hypothetical protein